MNMDFKKLKGYLSAFLSAVSYGMIPLYMIPIKESNFSLDASLLYRFAIGAVCILEYLIYKKENLKISLREFIVFIFLGLFYALSSEFLFMAYDYLTPGIASTIFFTYPIIIAIILVAFFSEKITIPTIISLFIVFAGVFILSLKDTESFNINFLGLFIGLIGAVIYGLYIILVNKSKIPSSGIKLSFYSLVFSSIYFLAKTCIVEGEVPIPDLETFGNLTSFSLITTVLSLTTLVYAINCIGSTPTAILGAIEPIIAVGISVFLFQKESLTTSLIIGVILIIIGVLIEIIFNKAEGNKELEPVE